MSGAQRNPSLSPPNPVPNPYQKSAKKPEPPPPPPQRTRRRHRPTRVGWAEQREAHHPRAFPGTQNTPPSRTPPRQTESPGRSNPPLTRQPIDGHLQAGTEAIGIHITQPALTAAGPCGTAAAASCTHYFIRDHLGSVAIVTGDAGCSTATTGTAASCLIERDSFDPWGRRRNATTWAEQYTPPTSVTTRGYTGHEEVNDIDLINMNARFYDPTTGRFLSPDPLLQPENGLQALNPYSYVLNNPLSATDPTGMKCHGWFGCTFGAAAPLVDFIVVTIAATACGPGAPVCAGLAAGAAQTAISLASGDNIGQALEQGAITGAEVYAFQRVGGYTDPGVRSGFGGGAKFYEAYAEQIAGDGLVGGLANIAQGQSFESGFLAAGFSAAAGPLKFTQFDDTGNFVANLVAQSGEGGLGSVIGGGKFENGAVTGAFGYLYNRGFACNAQCKAAQAQFNGQPVSWGISIPVSGVFPFFGSGGGVFGPNLEWTQDGLHLYWFSTPPNQSSTGVSFGISLQVNFAHGSGDWTGLFKDYGGSYGVYNGGYFKSPAGQGNWAGVTFGLGVGYPNIGGSDTTTNYTLLH